MLAARLAYLICGTMKQVCCLLLVFMSALLGPAAGRAQPAPLSPADSLRQLPRWPLARQLTLAQARLIPGTPAVAVAQELLRRPADLPRLVRLDLQASLGRYHIDNNQFSEAIRLLLEVRQRAWADSTRSSSAAMWICYAYSCLEQPRQAVVFGEEALRRLPLRPEKNLETLTNLYTILAGIAASQHDYAREEQYYRRSLAIDKRQLLSTPAQRRDVAADYLFLSGSSRNQRRLAAAGRYLDSARTYLPAGDDAMLMLERQTTAELALVRQQFRAAEQALQPTLPLIRTRPLWETEVLGLLVPALVGQGRYREALVHQQRLGQLQAQAFEEKAQRNAQELQEAYAASQREQQISQQRQRIERLQAQQKLHAAEYGRRLAWLGAGALAVVLLTTYGAVYWTSRQRQLRAEQEERLRQRLAADLHDEVGTLLARVSMQAELLGAQQPTLTPGVERLLTNSRTAARTMRDVVWGLDPQADNTASLVDRMREFLRQTTTPTGLQAELEVAGWADESLPPLLRQQVYLIFKEAVTNVVRHAHGATALHASLRREAGQLRLRIRDNGRPAPEPGSGLGLRSMRQRAESVGGMLQAGPLPEGGYRVVLDVPLA